MLSRMLLACVLVAGGLAVGCEEEADACDYGVTGTTFSQVAFAQPQYFAQRQVVYAQPRVLFRQPVVSYRATFRDERRLQRQLLRAQRRELRRQLGLPGVAVRFPFGSVAIGF